MLLRFHTNFEQAFVAYPSTHLHTYMLLRYHLISFYQLYFILHTYVLLRYQLISVNMHAYSLISNRRKRSRIVTPNIWCKIKPTVSIIWLQKNFKLNYLRIKFYCFFVSFWPPAPKVILVLKWRWCQIFQQNMNSHSVSHFIC